MHQDIECAGGLRAVIQSFSWTCTQTLVDLVEVACRQGGRDSGSKRCGLQPLMKCTPNFSPVARQANAV